ncbi:hypothetical protein G6F43_008267 [Rhizopus delemar]|nr:hypothetical protein G6F43_008267 [Rhizopus delemar]
MGFSFLPLSANPNPPPALKVLPYVDNVCVFLSSPADFLRLQHHLQTYGQVSNAKVNLSKTEAIFLGGKSSNQGSNFLHSNRSSNGMIILNHSLSIILDFQGRVTMTNTLLLSKLWYSLRVVSLPKSFFRQIRSTINQFISKGIKPGFLYALFCQPLSKCGLGLLDPFIQHCSLQVRWLRLLFTDDLQSSCSQVYLKDFTRRPHSSGTSSLLSCSFSALRSTADVSVGSFLPVLYTTMDSFLSNGIREAQCIPSTLLCLSIYSLFSESLMVIDYEVLTALNHG